MSDLAAVLIVSAAPLVGMLLIGLPWLAWSKRRKAQQRLSRGWVKAHAQNQSRIHFDGPRWKWPVKP